MMGNNSFDFIIIGGGFAGCSITYYLTKAGARCLLLESGSICSGTSGSCAGRAQIIESDSDEYLSLVLNGFSKLEDLGKELDIDLEWELPGQLTLIRNESQWQIYEKLVERLTQLKIPAEMLDASLLKKIEPELNTDNFLGAAFSHEGHLNPFNFCFGFANSARKQGTLIYTNSPVTGFKMSANRVIGVQSSGNTYYGSTIVLASGAWTGKLTKMFKKSIPIYHTHAEAIVSEKLPRIIHHHIGFSGFYEAIHGNERAVTLGLGQHRNGSLLISNAIQPADEIDCRSSYWGMPAIENKFMKFFPQLSNIRILRSWSAPSPFLPDFLPAIGWLPDFDNIFIACGFHLAIPTIPLLAEEIAKSLIDSNNNVLTPILKPFAPERFFTESQLVEN